MFQNALACVAFSLAGMACLSMEHSSIAAAPADRKPIRTLLGGEYWGFELTPDYLHYLDQVRPDLIHAGVLGPELASVIADPGQLKAITPIALNPGTTLRQYHDQWSPFLSKVHALGIRAQTTFSMINLWGDHELNTGFFRFYRELWEDALLGPRPAAQALDFLERDRDGRLLRDGQTGWHRYTGCVNNPMWRALLKSMVQAGVHAGFDGFMVQFPHARGLCACEHCQARFRAFLASRFSPEVLSQRFGIEDLASHRSDATGPRPQMPGPIDIEARQFGSECVKNCFDEVFIQYGRMLQPNLVVSMWTHFRQFLHPDVMSLEVMTNTDFASWMDERALLPRHRWGRDEDYLWYSSPVYQTKLAKGLLGDNTLDYKYLRAMAGQQPFHVLKYEYFRWRLTTAEAIALGGIAFGAWKGGWSGGQDREEPHLKTYFQFLRDHDTLFSPRESHAEVAVLYPRTAAYSGDVRFFDPVRRLGTGLMAGHVLFDFAIDEHLRPELLARYAMVLVPTQAFSSASQGRMLEEFAQAGGRVAVLEASGPAQDDTQTGPKAHPHVILAETLSGDPETLGAALRKIGGPKLSVFEAPWRVQVHADVQPRAKRLLVHLVNYDRRETEPGKEHPIAAHPVSMDLRLPSAWRVRSARFLTPESPKAQTLEFSQDADRLRLRSPGFLVYGLVVLESD